MHFRASSYNILPFFCKFQPPWLSTRVFFETLNFDFGIFFHYRFLVGFLRAQLGCHPIFRGALIFMPRISSQRIQNQTTYPFWVFKLSLGYLFIFSGSSNILPWSTYLHIDLYVFFIEKCAMASLTNILLKGNSKFNGRNYSIWKQRILAIFEYRNTDQIVLGVIQRLTTPGTDQDTWIWIIGRQWFFSNYL